jgi:Protein of unknown function (DUF3093)
MRDYRERLAVPASWWLLGIPVIGLLGGELWAGFGGWAGAVIFAVFAAGLIAVLVAWGIARIEVSDGRLSAGRSVLPLGYVTEVVTLDERQAAAMRGPQADPAAHLMIRSFLKQAVYIAVQDPAGQVPYWLVGTRRPAELAAAIERCRPRDTPAASRGSAG